MHVAMHVLLLIEICTMIPYKFRGTAVPVQ